MHKEIVEENHLGLGLVLLCLFAFLRPLILVNHDILFAGLNLFELFALIFSYLLIFAVFINIHKIKIDFVTVLILFFSMYCLLGILWGAQYREVLRFVLPFVVFFAVRILVSEPKHASIIIIMLILGFVYPISGSAVSILKGKSMSHVVYSSGMERFQGLFLNLHAFGHTMVVFSFIYALFNDHVKTKSKLLNIAVFILFLLSLFCLFKSNVRTALLGCFIFWLIHLWGVSKKYFSFFLIGSVLALLVFSIAFQTIFWQVSKPSTGSKKINTASSGRLYIWKNNLSIYSNLSVEKKILGIGLGNEHKPVKGTHRFVINSHNDYLTLLITNGILGLLIYLMILSALGVNIIRSQIDKKLKLLFLGMLTSVVAMNFVSNSYLSRFELGQFFWLFMGLFYKMNLLVKKDQLSVAGKTLAVQKF